MSKVDLTGQWSGMFHYPAHFPPNMFEAAIRDTGGLVSGLITQPREVFDPPGAARQAIIEGSHDGTSLSFVKIYDDLGRDTVHYQGEIRPGGDEIEGQWTIPGAWSGTFFMIRGSKAEAAETRKVSEKV